MSKKETVEVTLKLPKPIADWFTDELTVNLEDRLVQELVEIVASQVDCDDPELLMNKYGLKPVFKEYGVLATYYMDSEAEENE